MPGNVEGGKKAAVTTKALYGKDFYIRIGAKGGAKSRTGGFGSLKIGADGLTGRERAIAAGKKSVNNVRKEE